MAGHYKRGEVSPEDSTSQQHRVQGLLPTRTHSMGKTHTHTHTGLWTAEAGPQEERGTHNAGTMVTHLHLTHTFRLMRILTRACLFSTAIHWVFLSHRLTENTALYVKLRSLDTAVQWSLTFCPEASTLKPGHCWLRTDVEARWCSVVSDWVLNLFHSYTMNGRGHNVKW